MTRQWMPLFVGDYLRDTGHLSVSEHGAYLLLIMHYWTAQGLPQEDKKLARIARMTDAEWNDAKETIGEFFEPGWVHLRVERELRGCAERSDKARDSANRRWEKAKREQSPGNADAMRSHCDGTAGAYANGMLPQPQPQLDNSEIENHPQGSRTARSAARPKPSPKEILAEVVSDQTAGDLVAYRTKLRKPLTDRAARELAKAISATGNPEDAAAMMMRMGWQGFNPDWYANAKARAGPAKRGGASDLWLELTGNGNEQEQGEIGSGNDARLSFHPSGSG